MSILGDMPKTSKNAAANEDLQADFYFALADRARTLRSRRRDLTLAVCGKIMGVSESMASLKFNGSMWSAFEIRVMADALGVSPAVLYGDEPMPEAQRAKVTQLDPSKNAKRPLSD